MVKTWSKQIAYCVPEYLICKYPKKGNSWNKTVVVKEIKKSAKLKKILYTFNEILKQRDWILIRFTFYDHILTGFWTYSMPIAIRTMENNPPPSINIKDKFFSNNMRRLHGRRTFTDMTNSIRPSFNSARRCIQRKTRNEWHYYQTCHKEKIILEK